MQSIEELSRLTNMKANTTRQKILQAGLGLFSEKGYLGATTKEIARRAGVAELTLFRRFSSKDRLFEEIINSYSFLPALKGLLPEIKDLEYGEALKLIADKFLERLSERRQLIRIMHSEIQLYPSRVKKIYHNFIDEIFRTLASYFIDLQKKGKLREFKPELAARAFLGMFFSYFNAQEFMARKKFRDNDKAMVISEFVRIFVDGTSKGNNMNKKTTNSTVASLSKQCIKPLKFPLKKGGQGVVMKWEKVQPPLSPFIKGESNQKSRSGKNKRSEKIKVRK